ncbi:MAG: hypothetical protein WDN49_21720 [Acetobacteraceae bacterium]
MTRENLRLNGLRNRVQCALATGWQPPARAGAPYDLVFAISWRGRFAGWRGRWRRIWRRAERRFLAGLLHSQARMVLAAHRRAGLVLDFTVQEGAWTTLVLRRGSS